MSYWLPKTVEGKKVEGGHKPVQINCTFWYTMKPEFTQISWKINFTKSYYKKN